MSSVLKTAWRVVVRRAGADKAILLAAFATILIAITLMAAGPIYAGAVTVSSLKRTLIDAPVTESNLAISGRVRPSTYEATDELVFGAIGDTFGSVGGEIYRRGTSDSYSVAGLAGDHDADLVVFRFFTGVDDRIALLSGEWPGQAQQGVQVAVPEPVASHFGVRPGDTFDAVGRRQGSRTEMVEVTGIYRVVDVTDPYWMEDELDLSGVSATTSFTTYGPLLVTSDTFFAAVAGESSNTRWSAFPDHSQIGIDDVGTILGGLESLEARLNSTRDAGNQMQIDSRLDTILRETQRSLLVTRSAVLILTIQLVVLSGYALTLTSGLLADTREIETTTLRARGASSGQLLGMATMEGLILVIPAFAIGPPLAAWVLHAFNRAGPLAGIGLEIQPVLNAASWWLAALAASGSVIALVVPTYRSARRLGSIRAARSRGGSSNSVARRAGMDVALLAIAGLGIWQMSRYGTPLTRTVQGSLGIDPLLVAAPAIALLAGAVLALRALPLIAGLGNGMAARGRRLIAPLAIWHLGRQPRRYSRSALMLTLAVAIGVFAVSSDETWQTSQRDQAEFKTGADVLVSPSRRVADSLPHQVMSAAYEKVQGARLSVPIARASAEISGSSLPVEYVLLESAGAAQVMKYRSDQASRPIGDLLAELKDRRPPATALVVDGQPIRVRVAATMTVGDVPQELPETSSSAYEFLPTLRLVFLDSDGIPFRVDLGQLDVTGQPVRLTGDLQYHDRQGAAYTPKFPLRLAGVEVRGLAPYAPYVREARLTIGSVELSEAGTGWAPFALPTDRTAMSAAVSDLRLAAEIPEINILRADGEVVEARIATGATVADKRQAEYFMIWMAPPPTIEEIPVLVAQSLLDDLRLDVGDRLPLEGLPSFNGGGRIVGVFGTFPTVDPNQASAVVLDYPTYLASVLGPGIFPPEPDGYWLSVDETALSGAAKQLRGSPYSSAMVLTRAEALTRLTVDPVSLGTIGSLMMGLVAASVLAGIGFLVNVIVTTRERLSQFALMRAVGLSTRQLRRWMALENGATVGFAVVFGTALGILLANIILPLTAVTQQAAAVVPDLIVVFPLGKIAVILAGVMLALVFALSLVSRMLAKLQLAALLRTGDE